MFPPLSLRSCLGAHKAEIPVGELREGLRPPSYGIREAAGARQGGSRHMAWQRFMSGRCSLPAHMVTCMHVASVWSV